MPSLEVTNHLAAIGTILIEVVTVAFIALIVFRKKIPELQAQVDFIGSWALFKGFGLALVASAMTLYYSEILGLLPCGLCWMQRVFLYPQVFLLGLAWWRNDRKIADYIIVLSAAGLLIALYQHYLQMGGTDILPCPATGDHTDCAVRSVFEFGYITFPLMSASLFAYMIAFMTMLKVSRK